MTDQSGYFRLLEAKGPHEFDRAFYCPGCECNHGINAGWTVTYTDNKPTVNPSILVRWTKYFDYKNDPTKFKDMVCHSFIRNGKIEFLSDSTHALAGKTVDMELDAVS